MASRFVVQLFLVLILTMSHVHLATVDERCHRFSDCTSCTANTNGCQWCDEKKCISALSNCTAVSSLVEGARKPRCSSIHHTAILKVRLYWYLLQGVRNFTKCSIRNEQICSKLANCKSCTLNLNCQWDHQQHECHALPGKMCRVKRIESPLTFSS